MNTIATAATATASIVPSSSNPIKDAIFLNNHGVRLLDQGDVMNAVPEFQKAVSIMKAVAATATSAVSAATISSSSPSESSCTTTPSCPCRIIGSSNHKAGGDGSTTKATASSFALEISRGKRLEGLHREPNQSSFIYDCPLYLSPTGAIPQEICLQTPSQAVSSVHQDHNNSSSPPSPASPVLQHSSLVTLASGVIIFNFAISCHCYGKLAHSEAALQRAVELYDLSARILDKEVVVTNHENCCITTPGTSTSSSSTNAAAVMCLAFNNLSNLYYEFSDFKQCQVCLEYLDNLVIWADTVHDLSSSTLTAATGNSNNSSNSSCLEKVLNESETEEVILNIMYLQPPTAAKAA